MSKKGVVRRDLFAASGAGAAALILGSLLDGQTSPALAAEAARAMLEYQAATLADINALGRQLIAKDRMCQLIVRPK